MASWWQFRSITLYKISFRHVVKGRVGCNILFSTPLRILGESPGQSVRGSRMFSMTLASLAFFLIHVKAMHHRASTILMVFSDRRSNFWSAFERYSNFGSWTGRDYTQSNLRTSLRYYVSGHSGSKQYRNDQLWKTSVESHLVKHIHTYTHAYIHTYIHKWTSCMALNFKLWKTVELVIGPRSSLLFRGIPFNFKFEIFVERNVRCIRNSRITTGKI